MQLRFYQQALDAPPAVAPFLMRDEAANSVPLGVLAALQRDPERYPVAHLWAVEDDDRSIVGVAWHTPPHPMGLTAMPPAAVELLGWAGGGLGQRPPAV